MSRGSSLLLISIAIAIAPLTASALGLGDIHVDSDLNQPLVARVDIVGATPDELQSLSAAVANRDAFLRVGAERPAFLSSTTFKVAADRDGRAVLEVRSSDPFTDPLVSLLVDLRWPHGELIREYTLLLDPADASFRSRLAAATHSVAPRAAATAVNDGAGNVATAHTALPLALSPSRRAAPPLTAASHRRVTANVSLRRLARRAGAHGRADMHRMMLAIYRANPEAFDGSITRLRRGATLRLPTRAEAAALPRAVAEREYRAEVLAARNPAGGIAAPLAASITPTAAPTAMAGSPNSVSSTSPDSAGTTPIDDRVRSLERSIDELKTMLASEQAKFAWLQEQAAAHMAPPIVESQPALPAAATPLAAVLSFILGLVVALRWRRSRQTDVLTAARHVADDRAPATAEFKDIAVTAAASPATAATNPSVGAARPLPTSGRRGAPVHGISVVEEAAIEDPGVEQRAGLRADDPVPKDIAVEATIETPRPQAIPDATFVYGGDTTSILALQPDELFEATIVGMENVKLDYNLTDLDITAQHVHLPTVLSDTVKAEAQSTDIVDMLKAAIHREPHRRDLEMKLLVVYFSLPNKDAFMSLAEKLAQHREQLTSIDWQKVLMMGRQIAPDEALFKGDGASSTFAA